MPNIVLKVTLLALESDEWRAARERTIISGKRRSRLSLRQLRLRHRGGIWVAPARHRRKHNLPGMRGHNEFSPELRAITGLTGAPGSVNNCYCIPSF
jgi:hypothetical protein